MERLRFWAALGTTLGLALALLAPGCSEEEETTPIPPPGAVTAPAKLMAVPRSSFNLIRLSDTDNSVLIVGGKDTGGTTMRIGELYNPTTGKFGILQCPMIDTDWGASHAHARSYVSGLCDMPVATAASIFISGFGPCEIYDVTAKTFTQIAGVPPVGDYATGWNGLC
jgi:hypothetical protein